MTLSQILAKRMRQLRSSRNLSQEELAHKARSSVATVSNIERCLSSPTLDMIEQLASALDVPASDLLLQPSSAKGEEHFGRLIAVARQLPAHDLELAAALIETLAKTRTGKSAQGQ